MVKKQYKLLSIIFIILFSISVSIAYKLDREKNELNNQNNEIQLQLNQALDSINNLKNDSDKFKKQIDDLEKEKQSLNKKYKELENKYNLELASVNFNPDDVSEKSNMTINKIRKTLKGTGLEGLEESYYKAEKEYGINSIFLISLTAEESGWGRSKRVLQNNLSGYGVTSSSAKGRTFNSKSESIMETARLLREKYLTTGAPYYTGPNIYSINEKYCPVNSYSWANNINRIANEVISKVS